MKHRYKYSSWNLHKNAICTTYTQNKRSSQKSVKAVHDISWMAWAISMKLTGNIQ